jgi:VanZ family protein
VRRIRRRYVALGALWTAGAVLTLFLPGAVVPAPGPEWNTLAHVTFFAVAVALWAAAFPGRLRRVAAVAAALAVVTEVGQAALIPGRGAQWVDLVADLYGVLGGLALGVVLPWILPSRARRSRP